METPRFSPRTLAIAASPEISDNRLSRHVTRRRSVTVPDTVTEREDRRERAGQPGPLLVGDEAEAGRADAAVAAAVHAATPVREVEGAES
jgi:hypothetical protein